MGSPLWEMSGEKSGCVKVRIQELAPSFDSCKNTDWASAINEMGVSSIETSQVPLSQERHVSILALGVLASIEARIN